MHTCLIGQPASRANSQLAVPPRSAPFAPGGGLDRAGSVHGSSNDIPTHHGQLKKKPSKLAPSSVAAAAALGAVDGISQDSDATPPAAGKGAAAGPVAAGFTNPLTAAGVEAGSGGKDGVSARKPPLALQRSTGESRHVCSCQRNWVASAEEGCVVQ